MAVVGLGRFAELHLKALKTLPQVEVVAVVSRSTERAQEMASRYRVPHAFSDCAVMLQRSAPDAVDVVTEENRHYEPVMAALSAGKHVFVEKPLAADLSQARAMIELAETSGLTLMVGHLLRFEPRHFAIKQAVQQGRLGRIAYVYARRNLRRSAQTLYRHAPRLLTTGVHDADLILWYTGQRPRRVTGVCREVSGQGPDVFWGLIELDGGAFGVIESSWLLPERSPYAGDIELEVVGDAGTAILRAPDDSLSILGSDGFEQPNMYLWPETNGQLGGALRDELACFAQCILNTEHPPLDPWDAYRALECVLAILESANKGHSLSLALSC
jgi:UDP-N-acetylglucosamine 3-dehydrogenase